MAAALLLTGGCTAPAPAGSAGPYRNADHVPVLTRGGLTYVGGQPFSGTLYRLGPGGSHDTLLVQPYAQGREQGFGREYYSGGQLRARRYFAAGRKHGRYLGWWPNGRRRLDYTFLNDEYEGPGREWTPAGVLTRAMHYHQGQEQGRQTLWYDDGRLRANYTIAHGRRYGLLGTKNCRNDAQTLTNR